ncbi:hypothetical protein NE237_024397 [Protea cynaroides]|uniref:Late embryogenesis abundant protein LEA-2 subgroup domain-containing protein n=1 Tax=Protea cynaroides TaxID=273540 RepID=A0A9Q0K708_9MAGN|nr:hypothetical protein NE237_024397 [Protea cynaroides]
MAAPARNHRGTPYEARLGSVVLIVPKALDLEDRYTFGQGPTLRTSNSMCVSCFSEGPKLSYCGRQYSLLQSLFDSSDIISSDHLQPPATAIRFHRDSATVAGSLRASFNPSSILPTWFPATTCKGDNDWLFSFPGRVIASGTTPDPGSLTGNETMIVEVSVKVPYTILESLVRDIGADWDIDYELELGLTLVPIIENLTLPLSAKGEIKLPTFFNLL